MASIIDELLARGNRPPALRGLNLAFAGERGWTREPDETERDFLGRVRLEACSAGYRVVAVGGLITIETERRQ